MSDEPTVSVAVDVPAAQTGAILSIQAHAAKVRSEAGQMTLGKRDLRAADSPAIANREYSID